jgi:hypothetical protein
MLALVGTFALPGCSDNDDEEMRNVNVVLSIPADANPAVLGGEDFTFANGVRPFGTAGTSTTVEFTNDATGANITAGDLTASSSTEYGSCIFIVAESEFEPPHPLAPGSRVTIQQCTLKITARDVPVSGDPVPGVAILTLGGATSRAIDVAVRLDEDGSLFVNGVDTGSDVTGSEGNTDS